jgi:hypothetical protein
MTVLRAIGEQWREDNEAIAKHLEETARIIRESDQPTQAWLFVCVSAGKIHRFDYRVDSKLSAAALVGYAEVAAHRLIHHFEDITETVEPEPPDAPEPP